MNLKRNHLYILDIFYRILFSSRRFRDYLSRTLAVSQILGTLRQIARQAQVSMWNATENLRESGGSCWHSGDERAAAGGRNGSYSQEPSSYVWQAGRYPVPSSCSEQSSAKHGRAFRRHSKQRQEQLRAGRWMSKTFNPLTLLRRACMVCIRFGTHRKRWISSVSKTLRFLLFHSSSFCPNLSCSSKMSCCAV